MPDSMTSRERIIAYSRGEPTDRVPFVNQWGPLEETHANWKRQGMQADDEWYTLFNYDSTGHDVGVNFGICPAFERQVIREEERNVVFRDEYGVLQRARKEGTSMAQWLDYPVKDRKSWEEHKERFDPKSPGRFPPDWGDRVRVLRDTPELVGLGFYPYGFLSGPRTMMGAEACLVAMADDPELIEDIDDTLCELWLSLMDRIFEEMRVDVIWAWEDMAYKSGSLISPRHFRRFLTPRYRKIMDFARNRGAKLAMVDSDGLMHQLTGLFLEAGIDNILPYEVQAGNDVSMLLKRHPGLCAWGHIDKRAMAKGRPTMDAEIKRLAALLPLGRFIPHMDHAVPPDVSWENYRYMVWRWKEFTGKNN